MTKQRREGEANGPRGQRPARVSRGGPSWTEFVRLADQAVVANAGAEMINRAEPRACGYSRGPRRLDTEPETERNAGPASNEAGNGFGRMQGDEAGFQPYWGKPAVRNEPRGWRNRRHDLMAICHDARKGRHSGSHWSKPARLCSTRPVLAAGRGRLTDWTAELRVKDHLTVRAGFRRYAESFGANGVAYFSRLPHGPFGSDPLHFLVPLSTVNNPLTNN